MIWKCPGPLFTKWTDVLSQVLAKSQRREIRVQTFPIALKFDKHIGNGAAEIPVKSQSDTESGLETSRDLAIRRPSA